MPNVGANSPNGRCAQGIRDARQVTVSAILDYGAYLCARIERHVIAVSTAQNAISSINVILQWMRGDKDLWKSPSKLVGARCTVRETPPLWIDRDRLYQVRETLLSQQTPYARQVAAMIGLARELGLRWKEMALLDARTALRQAVQEGKISLKTGTKGKVPRDVPVRTPRQLDAIREAASAQRSEKSLVPSQVKYSSFSQSASRLWHACNGERFHDLRSAYACERYHELTGASAPVLNGGRLATTGDKDWAARRVIAEELGHHRGDVLSHYIGGRGR